MREEREKRALIVSRAWVQVSLLVFLIGFFVLGLLAYRTYTRRPADRRAGRRPAGATRLHRRRHPRRPGGLPAQRAHGVRLDLRPRRLPRARTTPPTTCTARRCRCESSYGGADSDRRASGRSPTSRPTATTPATDTLAYSGRSGRGVRRAAAPLRRLLRQPDDRVRPAARRDRPTPRRSSELTAFFAWSAWAASARRPGHDYSYTNNWPPEKLVDNGPTANVVVWSVVSLIALLGGIGLLFAAFGRWNFLGWHGREQATLSFRAPGDVALTPAQRACAWFFLVMAALFLLQTLVGAARQHYRAELGDFFGIDLAQVLPFNLARTFHVQLALFFVSTSFLAAGIFLAPMIAGREPRRQSWLAYALLGALAVVVFGSLVGEFAGVHGWFGDDRSLVRQPGLRVPRPRALLAGPARDRAVLLGRAPVPRAARSAAAASDTGTCRGCSSSPRSRSRRSTRSACWCARARRSRSPTSGASGSSTSGSRTSSSCSRR